MPETFGLNNIDPEDGEEVLLKVENSYNFRFGYDELKDLKTFGELCDLVLNKLQLPGSEDCTCQQAFYKFRDACCETSGLSRDRILPSTHLSDVFPRSGRRTSIRNIDKIFGFHFAVLRPKSWVANLVLGASLVSFVTLFINWKIGLPAFVICVFVGYLVRKFGKEFKVETIGELVRKMTRENYIKSRRNQATVNRKEVVEQIRNLFAFELDIDREALQPEAKF